MTIFIGGNEINDIKIGSTAINEVWVGANKVWSRLAIVVTGTGTASSDGGTATAFRYFDVSPAGGTIAWSYVVDSGPTNGGVISDSVSGGTYTVQMSNSSGFDTAQATITVTAVVDGNTLTATTTLTATRNTP